MAKAFRLANKARSLGYDVADVADFGPREWNILAIAAGTHRPSQTTCDLALGLLAAAVPAS